MVRIFATGSALAGLAIAAGLLTSCVVVEEPRPPRPPRPEPICTREYAPVCAERGGRRDSFANACMAEADGYRVLYPGQCRAAPPRPEPTCTREYAPVCAERGGRRDSFANACMAEADGYRVLYPGQCRVAPPPPPPPPEPPVPDVVMCPPDYAPVCAQRGGDLRTFRNSCEASQAEYKILRPGRC